MLGGIFMTEKPDIEYISRFFVPGSDAPQVAPKFRDKKAQTILPEALPKKVVTLHMDPVAVCSVVVAVVLLVMMLVSVVQFEKVCQDFQSMEIELSQLRDENVNLKHDYHANLDLAFIEEQAIALGLVPVSEVQSVRVQVTIPAEKPEPTVWDDFIWFLEGLFA
jgi:hypothetical protein